MVEQSGKSRWLADLQVVTHEQAWPSHVPPSGQVPQLPPQPSSPHDFPSHDDSQAGTHSPSSQTNPKEPQFIVEQSDKMRWLAEVQVDTHEHAPSSQVPPGGHSPHEPPHPSSPHESS